MSTNYVPIIKANLKAAWNDDSGNMAIRLAGAQTDQELTLQAFGAHCQIGTDTIKLNGQTETGPRGVVISLYARHAAAEPCQTAPWQAFAELPDSRPYVGAFTSHTETPLVPHVDKIMAGHTPICEALSGGPVSEELGGDTVFFVTPLPKIKLAYILYRADEDFPASAKCLFSANAHRFLPVDGLADVGEYTSQAIIQLVREQA